MLNVFSNGIKQAWRNFWVMTHSCKDSFLLLRESVSTGIKLLTFPYHRLLACTFRGLRRYETRNVGNLLLTMFEICHTYSFLWKFREMDWFINTCDTIWRNIFKWEENCDFTEKLALGILKLTCILVMTKSKTLHQCFYTWKMATKLFLYCHGNMLHGPACMIFECEKMGSAIFSMKNVCSKIAAFYDDSFHNKVRLKEH